MANEILIDDTAPARRPRQRADKLAGIGLGVIAAVAGGLYYVHSRGYESTDNAFIEGSVIQVSPRVAGQVLRVYVQDNQHVGSGDPIAEIDARDYEARAAEASARLADISARADGAQSNLALTSTVTNAVLIQTGAAADAAEEQVKILQARAAADAVRYRAMYAKDEVSKQQLDRAETQARATAAAQEAASQATEAAQAHLAQARAAQVSTQAGLRQAEKQVVQAQGRVSEARSAPQQIAVRHADVSSLRAQVEQQHASVEQAKLALSYTRIYAPESGYITRKSVEPGNFVQPGQPRWGSCPIASGWSPTSKRLN